MTRITRYALPLLGVAFVLFFLIPLGNHGLWIPDETRYAQMSQAMLRSGDWVSPHLLGLRYFEKPVAGYWFIAIGQALFGENLFGVRIASVLATMLSTLLVFLVARRLWNDPRRTWAASLLYMSFGLIAGQAGYSNLDPQFTLWANLSLAALWFALDARERAGRLLSWALLGFACGMGFMTKGFLAWLLPVIVALPYMLWQRRWRELLTYGPLAVLVAVLVSLPWVVAVHLREPDYWNFFFWNEHIRRFAGNDAQHTRPLWFFVPMLFAGALPWAALIPPAFVRGWEQRSDSRVQFLLLWFAMPFLFFSLSKGKLPPYIMPCFMPLALLMADALFERLGKASSTALRWNGAINLSIGALTLLGLAYLQFKQPVFHGETQSIVLMVLIASAWVLGGALQLARPLRFWAAPALGVWLLVSLQPAAVPQSIVNNKMPDQIIAHHLEELRSSRHLLSNDTGAAYALSWRLHRTDVTLYDTMGELKYGLDYPDAQGRYIPPADLQSWIAQARRDGSVGVVLRLTNDADERELARLPADTKVYREYQMVVAIIPQTAP